MNVNLKQDLKNKHWLYIVKQALNTAARELGKSWLKSMGAEAQWISEHDIIPVSALSDPQNFLTSKRHFVW